jgi:hypothetical protein
MPCRSASLAIAALWAAGCFDPTYVHPMCGRNGACPDGLSCNPQGVCDSGGPGGPGSGGPGNPGSGGGLAAFRLIAPMSLSTVTQRRPTLRWLQTSGDGTPTVELCRDRACTMTLGIPTVMAANRLSAVPTVLLPLGWVYWRVHAGSMTSATWQFWVGRRDATNPVDSSSGAILDVNGDGYPDFLVGSQEASAHLYLGGPNPGAAGWNVDPHPGRIDIPRIESTSLDYSPVVVASAGDVNGDGYGDFLVSSTLAHSGAGAVHLYLGSPAPSATDWDGASSRRIDLGDPSADVGLGQALAAAGDVNGDGYGDFLVSGGPSMVPARLYFGSAAPSAANWMDPASPDRIDLAAPAGATAQGSFGRALAGASDVNGDGFADFVVGAYNQYPLGGGAYVYLGSAAPSAAGWNGDAAARRIALTNPDSSAADFGFTVTSAGDVDGDGYSDFLVGVDTANASPGVAAYLYLGAAAADATGWNGGARRIALTYSGASTSFTYSTTVAGAGDVDGDGFADFVIGVELAPQAQAGIARVYLGGATPRAADWNAGIDRIDLAGFDGTDAHFGSAVSGGGDIDGDGFSDFVVSADYASATTGTAHVFLGNSAPHTSTWTGTTSRRIDLTSPDGANAIFGSSLARLAPEAISRSKGGRCRPGQTSWRRCTRCPRAPGRS